jgi:uncharacterized protein (DUF1499 family)
MRVARALVMAVCVAAFVMLIASGPGTRLGLWPWETGLSLVKWAAYTGMCGAVGAVILILLLVVPKWRVRPWVPVVALVFAAIAFVPPILLLEKAKSLPAIHDITTDPFDPPVFNSLMAMRKTVPNGADYGGIEIAKQQQKGYPDIKSLVLKGTPADTMQKAIDAARSMGWEIVASDAPAGRIEATDTTTWFGFKDDIIVRVRPDPSGGSRIDVRSVSRVGHSDVGANAARVRKYLSKLA